MFRCCAVLIALSPMCAFAQFEFEQPVAGATFSQRELQLLVRFAEVTEEEQVAIRRAVKPVVDKAMRDPSRVRRFSTDWIWPDLYEQLLPTIKPLVEDQAGYRAFVADLRLRQRFNREFAVDSAVRTLDAAVGLTSQQRKKLPGVLIKLYDEGLLRRHVSWQPMTLSDIPRLFGKLELTIAQRNRWTANASEIVARPSATDAMRGDSDGERQEALVGDLKWIAEAQVARIEGRLDIDPKTIRKLKLAAKGAIKKAVSVRIEAENEYARLVNQGETPDFDSQLSRHAMGNKYSMFHRIRWRGLVKSVLSESEWQQLQAGYDAEWDVVARYFAASRVLSMCYEFELSGNELLVMRDLFERLGPTREESHDLTKSFIAYKRMYKIPRQQYVELIGEEKAKQFLQKLESYRQYFPNVKEDPDTVKAKVAEASGDE
ncbi:MAG: hypothetical protein AB8G99_09605 [Planctomycetaceae bacterium]